MINRTALLIMMILALSACGRKGDLEAPTSALNEAQSAETHHL